MPAFAPFLLLLLLPLASALTTRYGTPGRFTAAAGSPDVTTTKLVGYSSLGGTLVQLTGEIDEETLQLWLGGGGDGARGAGGGGKK